MAMFLLLIGSLTFIAWVLMFLSVFGSAAAAEQISTADILVLGVYLVVTCVCFAGVGIISAVNNLKAALVPRQQPDGTTESVHRPSVKLSELEVG